MAVRVDAWQVKDSGLVAAPGPFRRLPGRRRHHEAAADPWPDRVVLEVVDGQLVATSAQGTELGSWPLVEVELRRVSDGPPVTFVVRTQGQAHLLAAAADELTGELLAAFSDPEPNGA